MTISPVRHHCGAISRWRVRRSPAMLQSRNKFSGVSWKPISSWSAPWKSSSRRTERLEQAAQEMKSEFVATLSHELRTPLTAIAGWVHILKCEPLEPGELAEGLNVIERNIAGCRMQLIDDLLDMSRIEAGKVTLDIQSLDLASVVESAIDAVRPAAMAKNIHLTRAFCSLGGPIMGDRNRLAADHSLQSSDERPEIYAPRAGVST